MRKQRRIAASVAAVLLSTAFTTTDATATAPDADRTSLFDLPDYPLEGFRLDGTERYLSAPPPPRPPRPTPPTPARAGRSRAGRAAAPAVAPAGDAFARLRQCESGGNYAANTGNGYYGAYQFSLRTWRSLGYGGYPHQAAAATQDEAARRLQARSGWGQWPSCSRRLGLR